MSDPSYLKSTFFEQLVEHLFLSEVLQETWYRFGETVEVLRAEVDSAGYDVVLECRGILRHVQLKTSKSDGATDLQKVNARLAEKPSGCVVWVIRSEDCENCRARIQWLYFGGEPGKKLPDLTRFPLGRRPKKKTTNPNLRVIRKSHFERLGTTTELVIRLFGADAFGRQDGPLE